MQVVESWREPLSIVLLLLSIVILELGGPRSIFFYGWKLKRALPGPALFVKIFFVNGYLVRG